MQFKVCWLFTGPNPTNLDLNGLDPVLQTLRLDSLFTDIFVDWTKNTPY